MDDYELYAAVGYGSFSTVYEATKRSTGKTVAIKVAKIEEDHEPKNSSDREIRILQYDRERIKREVELWKPLDHVNLCRLLDVIMEDGKVAFVMEYAKKGDLLSLISENGLSLEMSKGYFKQICEAVRYLHSNGIMHGDIKLENILLTEDGGAKLSDFGLARRATEHFRENCGTVEYAAPELLSDSLKEYPFKADMWALGVALYALLYRRFPFDGPTPKILKVHVLTLEPVYETIEDTELLGVLKLLLRKNPETRPSIVEVYDKLYG